MGEQVNPALSDLAAARASAEPLPGTLADAFLSDDIQITKDITVRRVVASDWKVLRWLDSPIVKQLLELQKPEGAREAPEYKDEDAYEICFQFTRPPSEVREAMKQGRETFREIAQKEIADKLPMPLCQKIVEAVDNSILAQIKIAMELMPRSPEPEKKT